MSELNQDELDIIKDILGTDEDDPIFGNRSGNTNGNNNAFPPSKKSESSSSSYTYSSSITKSAPISPKLSVNPMSTSTSTSEGVPTFSKVQKCSSVCIGGPNIPIGMTTEMSGPRTCSSLSCISCDHNVLRFSDRRWKKSTDYLFLRNNFPENVQQNLILAPGWCAYCCQCTFCEEQNVKKLPAYSSNWICRGHKC
ncbi:hypothetical protein M9Y10_013692 [Tritrichomonas musculus]|uniref:Cilia- and flagella-associated protein 418 n=1 Tax=Tritrichomonas musculus TaxID=1915356 RepID=A0ABR2KXH9_9EUKA